MSINTIVNDFVNITFINVEVHGLLLLPNAWVNMKETLMTVDFNFILNRCIFMFKSSERARDGELDRQMDSPRDE